MFKSEQSSLHNPKKSICVRIGLSQKELCEEKYDARVRNVALNLSTLPWVGVGVVKRDPFHSKSEFHFTWGGGVIKRNLVYPKMMRNTAEYSKVTVQLRNSTYC